MAVAKPQFLAFNAGELDANGLARADLENYARGAEIIENCFPYVQGRLEKAPGTIFVRDITSLSSEAVIRPFVVSESVKFGIELSDYKLRIISGTGYVQSAQGESSLSGTWVDDSGSAPTGGGAAPSVDIDEIDYEFDFDGWEFSDIGNA